MHSTGSAMVLYEPSRHGRPNWLAVIVRLRHTLAARLDGTDGVCEKCGQDIDF